MLRTDGAIYLAFLLIKLNSIYLNSFFFNILPDPAKVITWRRLANLFYAWLISCISVQPVKMHYIVPYDPQQRSNYEVTADIMLAENDI